MISSKIIQDSVSESNGNRITTFELEYPRFIHAELLTHRVFSRNAASSRAIPIDKVIEMVENEPAMPVYWGLNKQGMQANQEHSHIPTCEYVWHKAAKAAVKSAREMQSLGLHKQIVNRVLEPYQTIKTIVTSTTFDNWFWLRSHKDAQPEIEYLANSMLLKYKHSKPQVIKDGQWHLPYVDSFYNKSEGTFEYYVNDEEVPLHDAIQISSSCCAQVSYRKLDESISKARKIYDQLVTMTPVHASPFEHVATPITKRIYEESAVDGLTLTKVDTSEGITHTNGQELFSGNFSGWLQYRQLIPNNVCNSYNYKRGINEEG